MKKSLWLALLLCFASASVSAQQLSEDDHRIVDAVRTQYYSLEQRGLRSFQCSVQFDQPTLPAALLSPLSAANRKLLQSTSFKLQYDSKGPSVTFRFPTGSTPAAQAELAGSVGWMASIVNKFYLAWQSKGLHGPLPSSDSQIQKVMKALNGYDIIVNDPGSPVSVSIDEAYHVTRIVSMHGMLDERPVFTSSLDGLVYSGTSTTIEDEKGQRTNIQQEIDTAIVHGLRMPSAVHLRVGEMIDTRFKLSSCSVTTEADAAINAAKTN